MQTIKDDKGLMHIVRTPINMSNMHPQSPAQVGGQPALTQSTPLLSPPTPQHAAPMLPGLGIRAGTPQTSLALPRGQGPRLQRNNLRPATPTLHQQPQQQDEQQASFQEHYLKQLENKITTQQKGVGRGKVNRPSAQKRKMLSQQLGSPQQQQQQQKQQVTCLA